MNRYLSFGIPIFFGIGFLVLDNNAITSSNLSTVIGNIFSKEALSNINYYYKSNSFNLFDKNHISLDFYNIPLA
ncbi:MAG TPA: hypothetical protein VFM28_07195, partial [Nitrososphaeraceae archaeon]|nr:hypothetical protein [Nitrososphaeraceae archaeon]